MTRDALNPVLSSSTWQAKTQQRKKGGKETNLARKKSEKKSSRHEME